MLKNLLILLITTPILFSQDFQANFLGSYHTYSFDKGASEISAYDEENQIVYVVNADEKVINLIDILDPSNPTKVSEIDITEFGANVNSIAFEQGTLVAAIEGEEVDSKGRLILWRNGQVIYNEETGALPDMVAVSSNNKYTIVCNEGEPSGDYSIDPEGSITLMVYNSFIDQEHYQLDFTKFNGRKEELKNKGIRIFGPNATVAQDLEPEYAVFNSDNTYAYVVCQENNCLAVVDLEQRDIIDLLPLGVKDHFMGRPSVKTFNLNEEFENWPALGTPEFDGAQEVLLGGFSGLHSEQDDETGIITFYAVPDRGPNADAVTNPNGGPNLRPFYLPEYQARIVKFTYDPASDDLTFDPADQIFLTRGAPITGRGNIEGIDEVPVAITSESYPNQDYVVDGVSYHKLQYDPYGGDLEGIVKDGEGNFWICDEYRPGLYKFNNEGFLLDKYVTVGTAEKDGEVWETSYGSETLPEVYDKRRPNRGFEAIAYDSDENVIYAFIQSPLENPNSETIRNNSDVIRILGVNPDNGQPVSEYVYLLEQNKNNGFRASRVDKIGDAVYMGGGKFALIERDSSEPEDDPNGEGEPAGKKYVFQIDLNFATNILDLPISSKMESNGENDKTLEMMTADDLRAAGIRPVYKTKMLNLPSIGYHPNGKAEGISLGFNPETEQPQMYFISDNDFGLGGAGNFERTQLGVITFDLESYGFDASNRDDGINILPYHVYGMYQPDGMAMANIDGRDYILTANEGDGREYFEDLNDNGDWDSELEPGFVGESRIKDITLNNSEDYFDALMIYRNDEDLGRLKATITEGDLDGDGAHEYLYSYGARSFAIWDIYGNLIWDSGNDFETIIAELIPNGFNATNDENGSDDRSDDKGPEPEGIDVGIYNGRTYAVIGLERVSGFMVYDITNVQAPEFVLFGSNRDYNYDIDPDNLTEEDFEAIGDLGPEGILFIEAENSPTDKPLIITSNEISGNVSVYEFSPVTSVESGKDEKAFVNFSGNNPFRYSTNLTISLDKPQNVDYKILDSAGKEIYTGRFLNVKNKILMIDSTMLPNSGVYFVTFRTKDRTHTVKLVRE